MSHSFINTYNFVECYLKELRQKGKFIFTLTEIKNSLNKREKAVNKSLYLIKKAKGIAQLHKDFYITTPTEISLHNSFSPLVIIDELMMSLGRRYYVGLMTAAEIYSATDPRPQECVIVLEGTPLKPIVTRDFKLKFYSKKEWYDNDIFSISKGGAAFFISSPELTALDLFNYIDGKDILILVNKLNILLPQVKICRLCITANNYSKTSAIQRLGYVLEKKLFQHELAEALLSVLDKRKKNLIPLSVLENKKGPIDSNWQIVINK